MMGPETLSRREFLKVSSLGGMGLVLPGVLTLPDSPYTQFLRELEITVPLDNIRRHVNPESFTLLPSAQEGLVNLAFTVRNTGEGKPHIQMTLPGLNIRGAAELTQIYGGIKLNRLPEDFREILERWMKEWLEGGIVGGLIGSGISPQAAQVGFGLGGFASWFIQEGSRCAQITQALDPDTATKEAAKKAPELTQAVAATQTAIANGQETSEEETQITPDYTVQATSTGILLAPTLQATETPTFTPTFTMTPTETSTPIDPFSFDEILGSPTFSWRSPISKQTGNSTWLSESWGGIQESGGIIEEMKHPKIGSALKHTISKDSGDTIRAYMSIYSNERKKGPLRVRVSVLFSQDYYPLDKFNYHKTFVNLFGVFNNSPQTGGDYSILANVNLDPYGRLEVYPPPPYSGQSTLRYIGRTRLIPEQLYNLEFLFDGYENFCLDVNGVRDVEGMIDPAYRLEENKELLGVIGGHAGAYRRGGKKGMYIYNGPFEIDTWG